MRKFLLLFGALAILASTAGCVGCHDAGAVQWCYFANDAASQGAASA